MICYISTSSIKGFAGHLGVEMKAFIPYVLILGALVLAGCSGGGGSTGSKNSDNQPKNTGNGPSETNNGRCGSTVLAPLENIELSLKSYNHYKLPYYLQNAQIYCDNFKKSIGEGSCTDIDSSGTEVLVTKETVQPVCDDVAAKLTTTTEPAGPVSPTDSTILSSLKFGFSLTVKDAEIFNQLLNTPTPVYLQSGTAVAGLASLNANKPYCILTGAQTAASTGEVIVVDEITIAESGVSANMNSKESKLSIGCGSLNSDRVWTVQDMIDAFGVLAEVKVLDAAPEPEPEPEADIETGLQIEDGN